MRPRICFRCLTFFGINITIHLFSHEKAHKAHKYFCVFCAFCVLLIVWPRSSTVRSAFAFAARTRATLSFTGACLVDGIRTRTTRHRSLRIENLAAIDPNLHSDLSERRLRFGETVIDVRAQSVERKLSLQVPLAARD